jgi:hypothetical protein
MRLCRGRRLLARISVGALVSGVAILAAPADKVSGSFTVEGKTTKFSEVYATLETDPGQPAKHYLMLLVADVAVTPVDRAPARLLTLAKAGRVHALRIRWTYGGDAVAVVPYHEGIAESGRAFPQMTTLNLTKYDDSNIDAEFKSKVLGQSWQFAAAIKAAVANGGVATLEPDVDATVPASPANAPAASGGGDATALKRQLGALGYEFTPNAFFQAIGEHKVSAVELFLQAGMSPNIKDDRGRYALNHAVLSCGADAAQASAVVVALVRAKGDVKTKDPDNKTTPLVGAVQSCNVEAIDALIKAGSDLTAKSAGGMTALQLADIFQRPDIAALLRKAGAK